MNKDLIKIIVGLTIVVITSLIMMNVDNDGLVSVASYVWCGGGVLFLYYLIKVLTKKNDVEE